jgi:hypothetical protein
MPAASTHPLTTYTPQRESLVVAATDAEDDYFSYEQAARYGYAEEGGKFREKPHKVYTALARRVFRTPPVFSCIRLTMGQSQGDKYALLELAHLPPEMNKEEFARAWTQIVKRYQPATTLSA